MFNYRHISRREGYTFPFFARFNCHYTLYKRVIQIYNVPVIRIFNISENCPVRMCIVQAITRALYGLLFTSARMPLNARVAKCKFAFTDPQKICFVFVYLHPHMHAPKNKELLLLQITKLKKKSMYREKSLQHETLCNFFIEFRLYDANVTRQ